MTVNQTAECLGVSRRTVYRLVDDRMSGIPFIKIRSLLRFDPVAVDRWMNEQTIKFPKV